jgi:hypothetical protein
MCVKPPTQMLYAFANAKKIDNMLNDVLRSSLIYILQKNPWQKLNR